MSLFETSTASAIRSSLFGRYYENAKKSDSVVISSAASLVDHSLNFLNWSALRVGVPVEKADAKISALGEQALARVKSLQSISSAVASFDPFDLVDSVLDSTIPEEHLASSSEVPPMPEHEAVLPRASIAAAIAQPSVVPSVVVSRVVATSSKSKALSRRAVARSVQFATKQYTAKLLPAFTALQRRIASVSTPLSALPASLPSASTVISSSASILLAVRGRVLPSLAPLSDKLPLSVLSFARSLDVRFVALLHSAQGAADLESPRQEEAAPSVDSTTTSTKTTAATPESPQQVLEEQDSGFIFEPSQDFDESE